MFIPFGTDRAARRRPLITPIIIATNVVVFVAVLLAARMGNVDVDRIVELGAFHTKHPERVWTLFTSMFMHDPTGIAHILFNMIFLWVFGCAVEDRLGRWGFIAFYLCGGSAAALAQWSIAVVLGESSSMIGASGAVMAVTGGFVALFPRARVRMFILFFFIGIIWVPAMLVVGIFFFLDVFGQLTNFMGMSSSNTAFAAHIGGSIFGFLVAFLLLATKILKSDDFDIFFLFKQSRRRAAMRAAVGESAAGPWESATADTARRLEHAQRKKPAPPREPEIFRDARGDIARLLRNHDTEEAAQRYASVLQEHSEFVLSVDLQLDVASALFAAGDFKAAAQAYELYLERYKNDRKIIETAILLAVIFVRKDRNPKRALELLDEFEPRLVEQSHRDLATTLRKELAE